MIIYVVELDLEAGLRAEYLAWLRTHVAAMLTLPGFLAAEILEHLEPAPPAGRCALTVQYRLRDRADFDAYLRHDAPRMRAAGQARFGTRVRAARQLLEPL